MDLLHARMIVKLNPVFFQLSLFKFYINVQLFYLIKMHRGHSGLSRREEEVKNL